MRYERVGGEAQCEGGTAGQAYTAAQSADAVAAAPLRRCRELLMFVLPLSVSPGSPLPPDEAVVTIVSRLSRCF